MDRATRRERSRAEAKYIDNCAGCKRPYSEKPSAATFTGTYLGKWRTVCHGCFEKGLLDEIHGVGLYQANGENKAALEAGMKVLGPFLREMDQQGLLYRPSAAEKAQIAADMQAENPDAEIIFPDDDGKFRTH